MIYFHQTLFCKWLILIQFSYNDKNKLVLVMFLETNAYFLLKNMKLVKVCLPF